MPIIKSSSIKILILIVLFIIVVNITIILKNPPPTNNDSLQSLTEIHNQQKHHNRQQQHEKDQQDEQDQQEIIENNNSSINKTKLLLIVDNNLFNYRTHQQSFSGCPELKCEFTHNVSLSSEADGVLFFIPRVNKPHYNHDYKNLTRSSPNQLFFGWSMESPILYRAQSSKRFIHNHYNITIGYTRNKYQIQQQHGLGEADASAASELLSDETTLSHIYTPYGPYAYNGSNHYSYLFKFGQLTEIPQKRKHNIMFIAGNCKRETSGRTRLVKQMMKFKLIESFGSCLHNRDLKYNPGSNVIKRSKQKFNLLKQFNFVIAIENSICEDYVTEKLWEPLSFGTIPIYLGAPNINDYLPSPDAIINISNFSSVESLMNYVDQVARNETLRLKHLQWITQPLPEKFKILQQQALDNQDLFCNICKKLNNVDTNKNLIYTPVNLPFKRCRKGKFLLPLRSRNKKKL